MNIIQFGSPILFWPYGFDRNRATVRIYCCYLEWIVPRCSAASTYYCTSLVAHSASITGRIYIHKYLLVKVQLRLCPRNSIHSRLPSCSCLYVLRFG